MTQKLIKIEKKVPNHDKYVTTNDFKKFSSKIFDERLKQARSGSTTDITDFVTKTYLIKN